MQNRVKFGISINDETSGLSLIMQGGSGYSW